MCHRHVLTNHIGAKGKAGCRESSNTFEDSQLMTPLSCKFLGLMILPIEDWKREATTTGGAGTPGVLD